MDNMPYNLIGQTVIFKTNRKEIYDKSLKPIFPEHTFSACIIDFIGNFVLIKDIKLLISEHQSNSKYARELTLLGRDKLFGGSSPYNEKKNTCLIKVHSNLYFDIDIHYKNTNILEAIKNHNWFPKLCNICFYNLSTMEINFVRELFPYSICY